jgi:beta-mannanase
MNIHRLLILFGALLLSSCHPPSASAPSTSAPTPAPARLQVPAQGAYTGAYLDFGETEDTVTLTAIENFEQMTHKSLAIIASSSYWGEQSFPTHNLAIIRRHGAVPLVYWSPWDQPYEQDRPPGRFHLQEILAGKWDTYIDHWAEEAKAYGGSLLVAWGLEMNGTWFPWSGWFYNQQGKQGLLGPELYKRTYRYVVDRVRAHGAHNILWVFHANNYSYPMVEWNTMAQYYPGAYYVDWLGLSVYGKQFKKDPWINFHDALAEPYREIAELDSTKPIILAEWGIGEFPAAGNKARWIAEGLSQMSATAAYPRLKAAVFWHERWENQDGSYSNLRVNSSPESVETYRQGIASPFWLDKPIWR